MIEGKQLYQAAQGYDKAVRAATLAYGKGQITADELGRAVDGALATLRRAGDAYMAAKLLRGRSFAQAAQAAPEQAPVVVEARVIEALPAPAPASKRTRARKQASAA